MLVWKSMQNKVRLPIGVSDFQKLIKGKYTFADKSLFIKDVIEDGTDIILITRPRRFGKTLNLSMLYYFLEQKPQDQNLFEHLNVSKDVAFCKEHQQQYPVIFLTFKDVKQSNYIDAYSDIVELIRRLYEDHTYLIESNLLSRGEKDIFTAILNKRADLSDIKSAIKQLSVYITRKFNKSPIILMEI